MFLFLFDEDEFSSEVELSEGEEGIIVSSFFEHLESISAVLDTLV